MIRLVLAVWLCLAGPALATQDAWPALFDVTGVAADDTLNVRAAPDASAPVIGTLAHDAKGIEVIVPNGRHTWGLVNLGEQSGWVSLAYMQRGPGQWLGAFPEVRSCFGTEPFWSLGRKPDGALTWSEPGASYTGEETQTWSSGNRRDRHAFTGAFSSDPRREVFAIIGQRSCNDGMSDRNFGLSVDLLIGDIDGAEMLSGCCSLSAP